MDYFDMMYPIKGYTLDRKQAVYIKDFNFIYIPPYDNRNYDIIESIVDDYMWVETETGQRIAIHYPKYREVYEGEYCKDADGIIRFINFENDALPDHIRGIVFSGGILDYLFDGQRPVPIREGEDILTVIKKDRMEYTIPDDGTGTRRKIIIGIQERDVEINDFNRCTVKETFLREIPRN